VIVMEKSYLPDSGGAGCHRGGLGQVVRFRKRDDDGETMLVSVYPEGVDNPIPGLFGGAPGGGARGRVLDLTGAELRDCGTGELVELRGADRQVELILAGGSGFGAAADRPSEGIGRDIALGFVTPECARRDYGEAKVHNAIAQKNVG
jgi:5-oxoprolinase (ATP-hydrolysing)/N-methylhydantoinase A